MPGPLPSASSAAKSVSPFADAAQDGVAVHRGLEDGRRARQLASPLADAMDLDVVGVAVAPVVVVVGQHVAADVAEDGGQPLGRLVDVGLPEAVGVVVGRLAHHPRVAVAQELDPVGADHLGRVLQLADAALPELLALVEHALDRFAELAAGGDRPARRGGRRRPPWPSCPTVAIDSSSGWAWKQTSVAIPRRVSTPCALRRGLHHRPRRRPS